MGCGLGAELCPAQPRGVSLRASHGAAAQIWVFCLWLPPILPGSEPGSCSHCLQAEWDGGPQTPPTLTHVYWGRGFAVCFHRKPQQCGRLFLVSKESAGNRGG